MRALHSLTAAAREQIPFALLGIPGCCATRRGWPTRCSSSARVTDHLHQDQLLPPVGIKFYMNVGPQYMEPIARQLYQEIAMIEEEHVTHYESLVDPGETWWERLVTHEYNECYLYYSFTSSATCARPWTRPGCRPWRPRSGLPRRPRPPTRTLASSRPRPISPSGPSPRCSRQGPAPIRPRQGLTATHRSATGAGLLLGLGLGGFVDSIVVHGSGRRPRPGPPSRAGPRSAGTCRFSLSPLAST